MTLDEARTIWLTLLGSGWVGYHDIMSNPQYEGTLDAAYVKLRDTAAIDKDHVAQQVKIKCY